MKITNVGLAVFLWGLILVLRFVRAAGLPLDAFPSGSDSSSTSETDGEESSGGFGDVDIGDTLQTSHYGGDSTFEGFNKDSEGFQDFIDQRDLAQFDMSDGSANPPNHQGPYGGGSPEEDSYGRDFYRKDPPDDYSVAEGYGAINEF